MSCICQLCSSDLALCFFKFRLTPSRRALHPLNCTGSLSTATTFIPAATMPSTSEPEPAPITSALDPGRHHCDANFWATMGCFCVGLTVTVVSGMQKRGPVVCDRMMF